MSSLLYLSKTNLYSSLYFLFFSSSVVPFSFKLYFNILFKTLSCKEDIKFVIEVFDNIFKKEINEFNKFIRLLSIDIESFLSKTEFIVELSFVKSEYIFWLRMINIDDFISVDINI